MCTGNYKSFSTPAICFCKRLLCAATPKSDLNSEFGLRTGATAVGGIGVTGELDRLVGRQLKNLLETLADLQQNVLALLDRAALTTGNVAIATVGNALANGAGPDSDAEESFADVDDNTHDLTILLVLEGFANGGQHRVQPDVVDVAVALLLEAVRPLATVLVLRVLPLGADALLEQVVVRLECKVTDGRNVILVTQLG